MEVKLVSITKPLVEGINTAEELISYCARVSNPKNQLNTETAPKLLKYCIDNSHWSIFEMAMLCVEIKTSRAIAQQILRHKSFSFQEYSQRYSLATTFEPIELRKQGKVNRQGGEEIIDNSYYKGFIEKHLNEASRIYDMMIKDGVAKETARFILPLTTQTTLYMNGNIRSWITYFKVRCDFHCQKEHRQIAEAIRNIFIEQFPVISEALSYEKI